MFCKFSLRFDADVLQDVIKMSEVETVESDSVIIKQGDVGHRFYVILRGKVSVYINNVISDEEDPMKIGELSRLLQDQTTTTGGGLERSKFGNCVAEIGENDRRRSMW